MKGTPVDYLAAIEQFRREELTPDNQIHSDEKRTAPPMIDGCVDYQAAVRKWDKQQAGKYTIYTEEHEKEGRL